ncbi:MAG: polysaccharide deacetylase family protein [Armatimonadetes bacterium]|nr:polysaccharide deacetylase family protein [Armatimonadota bacterium]
MPLRLTVKTGSIILLGTAALCVGVMKLRRETNGLRNAISPQYWSDRAVGRDLYNPDDRFFKRGPHGVKEVCFTFDDGPHAQSATKLLDLLKERGIHVTFFVVGQRVKEHPELVKRMIDEGHEVGNHTQDHLRLPTLRLDQVEKEITNCELNVERAAGVKMAYFRPPGMQYTPAIMEIIKKKGYTTIGWDIGAKDFTGKDGTPDVIRERVVKQINPGAIILLHDNPITVAAMPAILDYLNQEGYTIKTVTQMLAELPRPVAIIPNPPFKLAEKSGSGKPLPPRH